MKTLDAETVDMSPWKKWLSGLASRDQRRGRRQQDIPLVAYYWDGAAPVAHRVRNISMTGLYLVTEQRWFPGTLVTLTLQRTDRAEADPQRWISVQARVVRADAGGVGLRFLPTLQGAPDARSVSPNCDKGTLERFVGGLANTDGQALIEYLLVLPVVFVLIVNVVNFGGLFYAWITVANAARAGTDYAILGGASVGGLKPATATQVNSLITQDVSSLPNRASLSVSICQNNNGTVTTLAGTCTSVPSDPEAPSYVLTSIDVDYTYQPFIPASFQFPSLSVYATLPPTTVHRRALMRSIQ